MRIISQVYVGDGKFMLQLGGLSTETKPTDSFVATGSQFFEDDTDAVFSFNGSTWDLDKNGQMKDLPVVTATDNGKILKVDNGVWSIGIDSGSSLPSMTGKNGKVLGVTLDSEDKEQAEWVTPPSGGGAEKFVVTLTRENDTWTADKTYAEIAAARQAGKVCECVVPVQNGVTMTAHYVVDTQVEGVNVAGFSVTTDDEGALSTVIVSCINANDSDEWKLTLLPIPNAPLIVTITTQDGVTFTADKSVDDIFAADAAGKECVARLQTGVSSYNIGRLTQVAPNSVVFGTVVYENESVVSGLIAGKETEQGDVWNVALQS